MPKLDYRKIGKTKYEAFGRQFWKTCMKAKNTQDLTRFIDGLLSPSEKVMVSRRILIAKMLLDKKSTSEIMDQLQVGQSTVAAVARWLDTIDPNTKKILQS
jgi:Trp operon repressor